MQICSQQFTRSEETQAETRNIFLCEKNMKNKTERQKDNKSYQVAPLSALRQMPRLVLEVGRRGSRRTVAMMVDGARNTTPDT
jgi:hypothetical protein